MKMKSLTGSFDLCTRDCLLDYDIMTCMGCGRTLDEISNWFFMSAQEKYAVAQRIDRAKSCGDNKKGGK